MLSIKQTETFQRWVGRLKDRKAQAVIAARILRVANGLLGDVSPVGEGVSELRIHYGPGYRIYFQFRGKELIILLCGGNKSTQESDIALAKRIAKEWSEPDEQDQH